MDLSELHELLNRRYEGDRDAARQSPINQVPNHLPVCLRAPGEFDFLPASSLAVQALLPEDSEVHGNLVGVAPTVRAKFPSIAPRILWQPLGTLHLNIVILKRLSKTPLENAERKQLLDRASPLCVALDALVPFSVEFRGLLLRNDGCLVAVGFPDNLALWAVRQDAVRFGFPDQQGLVHVTIGRVLTPLTSAEWRGLVDFVNQDLRTRYVGTFAVERAILIDELRGFMYTPSHYTVHREFRWGPPVDLRLPSSDLG